MLISRELDTLEQGILGSFGRIHENTTEPEGQRQGIILVHGRAGDEKVMWVFSRAIQDLNAVVISPRAIIEDPIGGYSWWLKPVSKDESDHVVGDRNLPLESSSPHLATLSDMKNGLKIVENAATMLVDRYGVNSKKIRAIGFSQGAALIASVALSRPRLFQKVALLAGFIPELVKRQYENTDFSSLPKVFISHGTEDQIINFSRAEEMRFFLESKSAQVHFHSDNVGHKISGSGMKELREWVKV